MIGTQCSNHPNDGADLIAKAMKILMGCQLQRGMMEAGRRGTGLEKEKPYGNAKA